MFSNLFQSMRGGADVIDHDAMVEAVKNKSAFIVDVRERNEFMSGHIEGAINVPMSGFDAKRVPKGKPVIVYCLSGARSAMAQRMLAQAGYEDVKNYRSGIGVWRMHGGKLV